MILPLDGPAAQNALSVTTETVVEAKAGASTHPERKAVTLQPTNGDLYIYFGDESGIAPSVLNTQTKGLQQYSGSIQTYEASSTQKIYILAVTGTTNTIVVERA